MSASSPMKLFVHMAAGVPIVAANNVATREVLRDGYNARLVAASAVGIAHGVNSLLQDVPLSDYLRKNARADVDAYSWTMRGRRLLDLVERQRERSASPATLSSS